MQSPECQYILDCAVEFGEITPMEANVLKAATPAAKELSRRLDACETLPPHFLRNTARAYLDQVSHQERMLWALRGAADAHYALRFLRERMEFVVQTKALTDLGIRPAYRVEWLDELARPEARQEKWFSDVDAVSLPVVSAYLSQEYGEALKMLEHDLALAEEAVAWLAQPGARERAKQLAESLFGVSRLPAVNSLRPAKAVQVRKQERKHARGAIKKGLALLSRFGRQKEVQLLVSGQRAVLSHPDSPFKLELVPYGAGWLEDRTLRPGGHTPFEVHLLTKDDVHLSRLCVYFKDTPVLDQLMAFSMYIDTGLELELFERANWFGIKDEAQVRAVLQDKAPRLLSKLPVPGLEAGDLVRMATQTPEELAWAPFRAPVSQWVGTFVEGLSLRTSRLGAALAVTPALPA